MFKIKLMYIWSFLIQLFNCFIDSSDFSQKRLAEIWWHGVFQVEAGNLLILTILGERRRRGDMEKMHAALDSR